MNFTSDKIIELAENEVFVFGSNRAGRHGKGAARQAVKFGAIRGQGEGLAGQTYGICTKGRNLEILSLKEIEYGVNRFLKFAANNTNYIFLVTPIGCGLAGYKSKQIAPLFEKALELDNVILPECFWNELIK